MRYRSLLVFVAGVSVLAGCKGLKDALTAHVDVAARAGSQELSTTRLADLIGNTKLPVPVSRDNANILANLWVNYELMAHAAAVGDSLNDHKMIDRAVAPLTNNMRLRRYMDSVFKSTAPDSGSEEAYNRGAGNLFAARHILLGFPANATPAQKDSVRAKAAQVRAQTTPANFAAMAGKYSTEPNAGPRGGSLGVFRKEQMVPEFSNAVAALKPGEISQPIETQFGFHIIQRLPYDQAKAQFSQAYSQSSLAVAESTYLAKVDAEAGIDVKGNAAAAAKAATEDIAKHRHDDAVLASYKGGDLNVGEFVTWLEGFPPQSRVTQQLAAAPDSSVTSFVRNIARNQVLLERAEKAGVGLAPEDQTGLYRDFGQLVQMVWQGLGIEPRALADSAKSAGERERIASARVEAFLNRVMAGEAQPVPIPSPLESLLRDRYEWSINKAGLDRATERAQQVRTVADSARAANQPKSTVPIPMGPGQQPPVQAPQGAPQGAPPVAPRP